MRHSLLFATLPMIAAAIVAAACSDSSSNGDESVAGDGGDASVVHPGQTPPSMSSTGPAGTGRATGLPCDVQAILENRCIACHGGTQPPSMLDYDDLVAPSLSDPKKSVAVVSFERMKAKTMPPAPAAPPEDDEIASFEEWVKAGTPKNSVACTDPPPAAPDAGALADAGDAGVVCTSGKTWTGGNEASALMHPGAACNACHQINGGPNLRIAGTVYSTLHEPNDCNGKAPPPKITVTITDARNRTYEMEVNEAGNFFTRQAVRAPFKASISDGTKTRAMIGSVTSGDCNSCHSVSGANGAPGRILAP